MARNFNGSQYCEATTLPNAVAPVTISAWFKGGSTSGIQRVCVWSSAGGGQCIASIILNYPSAGDVCNQVYKSGVNSLPVAAGKFTPGTWHHAAVITDVTAARAYLDAAVGGDGAYLPPVFSNCTIMSVGRIQSTQLLLGEVAYLAAWSAVLTVEEIAELGRKISGAPCGVHPWLIRPGSLLGCWPLGGFHGEVDQDLLGNYPLSPFGSPTWTESPAVVYPCNSQTTRFLPPVPAEEPGPDVDAGLFDTAANEVTDTADNTLANTWYAYLAGDILDTVAVGIDDTLGFAIGDTSEQTTVPLTFSCPVVSAIGETSTATLTTGGKTLSAAVTAGAIATASVSLVGSTLLSSPTLGLTFASQVVGILPGAILQIPPTLTGVVDGAAAAVQAGVKTLTAGVLSGSMLQSAADLLTRFSMTPATLPAAAGSSALSVLASGLNYGTPVVAGQFISLPSDILPGELRTLPPTLTADLAALQTSALGLLYLASPVLTGELQDLWLELSPGYYVALPPILNAVTAGQTAGATTGELRMGVNSLSCGLAATSATILPGVLFTQAGTLFGIVAGMPSDVQANLQLSQAGLLGQLQASVAAVTPGERLWLPPTRQGTMTAVPAEISAWTLALAPAPAEIRMYTHTITVRQQMFFYPGILLLQGLSSDIGLLATLSTSPVVVSCELQTESAVIDSPLSIVPPTLGSALSCAVGQLLVGELRLAPGVLQAAPVVSPVIIVNAYYGLYADTPFIATTGSMFE